LGKCLVDDEEASSAVDVAGCEGAAFEKSDAHGAEVVGADIADLRVWVVAGLKRRSAFD